MIEILLIAHFQAQYEMEHDKRWYELFMSASSEEKKLMLERREDEKREREIERRHREQIRAQEKIAEAIRFAVILR